MKKLPLFLLCTPLWAALSVPLTVKEAIYPGSVAGVARTNEPFCRGVPIPDAAAITSTGVLGLTGATAGQFRILGSWPSGHAKWIEVCGIIASLGAGGTTNVTLTDSGSGNFGGSNLATGSGTITVATGTVTFTIKSANFNLVDTAVVGATTVVATGASPGLVVMGPSTTGTFPDNVTCGSGAGQSPCTRIYSSANDATATSIIEENGPVKAVIKSDFSYKDVSGNAYFKGTARQTFYKNKTYDSVRLIDRNADYSASANFTSAFKGMLSHEMRLTPTYANANPVTYQIAADSSINSGACTSADCTGTLTQGGSDFAYIYQGQSTFMHVSNGIDTPGGTSQNPYLTGDLGYQIYKNSTNQTSGNNAHYPTGWADIADSTGRGIEIGVRHMAAYYNKSLEFTAGGANVAIGLWPSENGNPTGGPGNGTTFHYQPWLERAIFDFFVNFHTSALTGTTAANAFLSWQHPLVAYETWQYANTTSALANGAWPLTDPAAEDAFYNGIGARTKPARSITYSNQDWGVGSFVGNSYGINAPLTQAWGVGGPGTQKDYSWSHMMNLIRRGHTGEYTDAFNMQKLVMEKWLPWLDGGDMWKNHANNTELDQRGFPIKFLAPNYSQVYATASPAYDFADFEHRHRAGIIDMYYETGDETYKDWINNTLLDYYTNNVTQSGSWGGTYAQKGTYINDRSVGSHLEMAARLSNFLTDQGDSTNAAAVITVADNVYNLQLHIDLCASGYPAGCTVAVAQGGGNKPNASGVSRVRGMMYGTYLNNGGTEGDTTCGTTTFRVVNPFKQAILQTGMWEYRNARGSGWQFYNEIFDLMYGISQFALTEDYADPGTGSWADSGFRYYLSLDTPNNIPAGCSAITHILDYYQPRSLDDVWMNFTTQSLYNGSVTAWKEKFINAVQRNLANGDVSDVGVFTSSAVVNAIMNPPTRSLVTAQIAVSGPSGGNYSVTVTVPPGATGYRAKCATSSALALVEWIGFDPGTNTWAQASRTPATFQNWFAGIEITGLPSPTGTTQVLTIPTSACGGQANLTTKNFMVKAWVTLPANTWIQVKTHGIPVSNPGNPDSMKFNSDLDKFVMWGNYHDANSEVNNAIEAYDLETNNWSLIARGEPYSDQHLPESGHSDGQWLVYDSTHMIHLGSGMGSGSSGLEALYLFWPYDLGGQTGFQRFPAVRPGRPADPAAVWDPVNQVYMWDGFAQTWWYNWVTNTYTNKSPTPPLPPASQHTCLAYNPDNQSIYLVFGDNSITYYNTVWKYTGATNSWVQLATTNTPSARSGAACDYDTRAGKIFVYGGKPSVAAGDSTLNSRELWALDTTTLAWTLLDSAGPIMGGVGTFQSGDHMNYDPIHNLHVLSNGPVDSGSHPYLDSPAFNNTYPTETWIYRYGGVGGAPGITEISATSPVASQPTPASLNRDITGWAQKPTVAVNGSNLYVARSELGTPFGNGPAMSPVPYVDVFNGTTWSKAGSDYNATVSGNCAAGANGLWYGPQIGFAGGNLWLGFYGTQGQNRVTFQLQGNNSTIPTTWNPACPGNSHNITAASWSSGIATVTIGAHTITVGSYIGVCSVSPGGATGYNVDNSLCGVATASPIEVAVTAVTGTTVSYALPSNPGAYVSGGTVRQRVSAPQSIEPVVGVANGTGPTSPVIDVGGVPYFSAQEQHASAAFVSLYVRHWNGSAWVLDGPAGGIQNNASSVVLNHQMFADGAGHACVIWSEYTNTNFQTASVTQVYVSCLISGTWTLQGGSANKNTANWATFPSATVMGGVIYAAWTERTATGVNQVIARKFSAGAWSDVGTVLNKDATNGWGFSPSIFNDGTNLYAAWTEGTYQHQIGGTEVPSGSAIPPQWRSKGYVAKFPPGGPWAILGMRQSIAITSSDASTPTVVTSAGHQLANGDVIDITGMTGGASPPGGTPYMAGNVAANTFALCRYWTGTACTGPYTYTAATGGTFTKHSYGAFNASLTYGSVQDVKGVYYNGAPTVVFTEVNFGAPQQVYAQKFDGSNYVPLGAASLSISTPSLPATTVGVAYSQTLTPSGGTPPYTWAITSGALPTGLSLGASTGVVSGTTTATATSNFTVQLTDSLATTATKALSIVVNAVPAVTRASPMPGATTGAAYSQTLANSGGTAPFTWSISAGSLPAGLAITPATGVISGTAQTAGLANFTARILDNTGVAATKAFTITTSSNLTVTTATPMTTGTVSAAYSQTLTGSGGFGADTWAVTVGTLPAGLSLAPSTGIISGTPTGAATSNFTAQATDAGANAASKALAITINAGGPVITTTSPMATGAADMAYSQTLTSTGGTAPFTWSITAGALPTGLTLAGSTGIISGIPTTAAASTFTVQVIDSLGLSDSRNLSITTIPPGAVTLSGGAVLQNKVAIH